MSDCIYCNRSEQLLSIMIPICSLQASEVYLFKDQFYPGRCVVALKEHKRELFELDAHLMQEYMKEVAAVARVLQETYQPNKLNYAVYGDIVDHFHVHLVPKYMDRLGWGKPFLNDPDLIVTLDNDQYNQICSELRRKIFSPV